MTALLSRTYDLPLITLSLDVDTAPTPPEPRGIRLSVEAADLSTASLVEAAVDNV